MKHNLKDFPKAVDGECDGFRAWAWKLLFEKELRVTLKIFDEGPLKKENYDKGRSDQIKEILGE